MKSIEHLDLLGYKAKDKVTGIEGVITSICFDLYGCIQVDMNYSKDGESKHHGWIDVTRVEVQGEEPVMELPDFDAGYVAEGKKGSSNGKPVR